MLRGQLRFRTSLSTPAPTLGPEQIIQEQENGPESSDKRGGSGQHLKNGPNRGGGMKLPPQTHCVLYSTHPPSAALSSHTTSLNRVN